MYVYEGGSVGAPTIVFLHAINTSGWMWETQVKQLAAYHCLVPDFPGHGRSHTTRWQSLDDTVQQIAQLIAQRATNGRAHIVGLSLGAYVALRLLLHAPERIDHAIISGLNVLPFPNPLLMRVMGFAMLPFIKSEFMLRANAKGLHIPDEQYDAYRASARAMSRAAFLRIGDELMGFRLPEGDVQIQCPTLVVAGQNEQPLIRQSLSALLRILPYGQGRIVPGVGHGWNGEAPDLFTRMVDAWMNDQPLPSELLPLGT
jgi:pimeloyl-ACP methyl ester carboxylesterase